MSFGLRTNFQENFVFLYCLLPLSPSILTKLSNNTGNVGVPIKLLFEAEGMKVTVEVRILIVKGY